MVRVSPGSGSRPGHVSVARIEELDVMHQRNMPDAPSISNLWDTASRRGFDYLATYKSYVSYGAEGFYPGEPVSGAFGALMTGKGDLNTPIWFNEFTAGGGGYYGTPGRSRMYAYLGLMMGAQGILAWTFNSHLGGEEQALFGLVDHDDTPSWKVDEFARVASEFEQNSRFGFRATRIRRWPSHIPSIPSSIQNRTVPPVRHFFMRIYLVPLRIAHASIVRPSPFFFFFYVPATPSSYVLLILVMAILFARVWRRPKGGEYSFYAGLECG